MSGDETIRISPPKEGEQDWHLLVTDGHVRGHRLVHVARVFFWPSILSGLLGAWFLYSGLTGGLGGRAVTPESVSSFLVSNPDTYAALPGHEGRLDYRFAWLAGATGSPQRGMTGEAWTQLVQAASADIRAHADRAAEFTAIPALATDPKVTRPERALSEFKADLTRGIVTIPAQPAVVPEVSRTAIGYVVGWVEGKLAFAVLTAAPANRFERDVACFSPLEPLGGCAPFSPVINQIQRLRPQGGR